MNIENLNKLITQSLAIEEQEAKEAGMLGYMARILVQATLPHSNPKSNTFERENGKLSLAILGHPKVGIPYGTYPRLILSWLVTEAVKKKNPKIVLGSSLSQFMNTLGLSPTGGRWGNIRPLRDQMIRLFSASISCFYTEGHLSGGLNLNITKAYQLWWDPKNPDHSNIWESVVILGQDFFDEIIARPVPIDVRVLKALKTSSMALDLYCWLTYRLSYLKNKTEIPWLLLQKQFGSDYADTRQGRYCFKQKLFIQLKKVIQFYEGAQVVTEGERGLILTPSKPHINKMYKLNL
jgi:hypothetical protein